MRLEAAVAHAKELKKDGQEKVAEADKKITKIEDRLLKISGALKAAQLDKKDEELRIGTIEQEIKRAQKKNERLTKALSLFQVEDADI